MPIKYALSRLAILLVFVLAACQALATTSPANPATPTSAPTPTLTPTSLPTITRAPDGPRSTPTLIPTQMAGALRITTFKLRDLPPSEGLQFTTAQGQTYSDLQSDARGTQFPDRIYFEDTTLCMQNDLNDSHLVACQLFNADGTQSWVTLTRDGKEIYSIETGPGYAVAHLQGLWVYADHWVLETVHITTHEEGNTISADLVGQLSMDGVLLNDRNGYAEAFGFQTIAGKPFFFFTRDGRSGFSYDGTETPLEYERIPHYGCCSAAARNPASLTDQVSFLGQRAGAWYYVVITTFGTP